MPVHEAADCRAQNCHHHREPLVPRDVPHDSAVDAYVDHGPPPEARPIGFLPPSDPTRRSED